jgi:hypothetical protein
MNILLWVVQLALAVFSFAGGAYKIFSFDELAKLPATGALPRAGSVTFTQLTLPTNNRV